jgi:hypothetical protein
MAMQGLDSLSLKHKKLPEVSAGRFDQQDITCRCMGMNDALCPFSAFAQTANTPYIFVVACWTS